ncbi:hypothetical protein [Chondromyces crocatus]|uniref:Uncharacterized protein n=1 Tax=Chondromyces crocatus TaxID=52 RepID=A0A0K1EK37_CHOCO|nr:hypothetical protein [Chondromyces crocatus]AKT40963.1 uncharacterized protein CMC5_051200 [Chondromyces crocatus]
MSTKKPKTGGEIDSWCTKCKLDLTHRIIAMVGDDVKKVECKTCGSHHLYRPPKSERERAKAQKAVAREARESARSSGTSSKSSRSSERASAKAERDLTAIWEKAIAGQPAAAFKPYRITLILAEGELVRHSKFGDGVVARVLDPTKVEILFNDGIKVMAQGQQLS